MKSKRLFRPGFGMIELLVVLVIIVIGMAIMLPQLSNVAGNKPSSVKSRTKDMTNLYSIQQAVSTLSGGVIDEIPMPSEIDRNNATVPATRFAKRNGVDPGKDTSDNFFSMLIFERVVDPRQLVAPSEPNLDINVDEDYQYAGPPTAVDPNNARWDPAFSADFTSSEGGNLSYAMQCPQNKDRNGHPSSQPMFSHRGPEIIDPPIYSGNSVQWDPADPSSLTLDPDTGEWSGGVVYKDGHAETVSDIYPGHYVNDASQTVPDLLFYDEPDDPDGTNAFLSIFVEAGAERQDFYSIWD